MMSEDAREIMGASGAAMPFRIVPLATLLNS